MPVAQTQNINNNNYCDENGKLFVVSLLKGGYSRS